MLSRGTTLSEITIIFGPYGLLVYLDERNNPRSVYVFGVLPKVNMPTLSEVCVRFFRLADVKFTPTGTGSS